MALVGCTPERDSAPQAARGAGVWSVVPQPTGPRPGSPGAGDPYFPSYGNGGYDVTDYAVKVRFNPATDAVTGTTTVTAKAAVDLSRFNLDLHALTVASVTVDGVAATHTHVQDELAISPATPLVAGKQFVAVINYGGQPRRKPNAMLGAGGFLNTADGAIALGQPESATTWFPVNDHPSDKARYSLEITVPAGLTALSNGKPGPTTTTAGWTTWKWSESTPMASYLTMAVIGNYRVKRSVHKGRPVVTAVPASAPAGSLGELTMAKTTAVADYLETVFGPYPVDAYGGVVVDARQIGYALETQSRPVYGPGFFTDEKSADAVLTHELAHQWFGNSVALDRWQDIWLNEGFASYAEWLWTQQQGGQSAQEQFDVAYRTSPASIWRVPPGRPGPARIFDGSVYRRGAMTVHALRVTIGDEAFFRLLKEWTATHRDGNVRTADFVALAEKVSGRQLDQLFDAWLYGVTRPPLPTAGA
ncbi:M1 family metallopeptidase [Pilimelia columellifera]